MGTSGRVISIASAKGGVGKSTLAINLAYVSSVLGKRTLLLDCNLTAPDISTMLDIPYSAYTLHDHWLDRGKWIGNALHSYKSDLYILPGKISPIGLEGAHIKEIGQMLLAELPRLRKYFDTIVVDSAPGLNVESVISLALADDVILISEPYLPSLTNAYRTMKFIQKKDIDWIHPHIVINKYRGTDREMSLPAILDFFDMPCIAAVIPYESKIKDSLAYQKPFVQIFPETPATNEFKRLASNLNGIRYRERKKNFWARIFGRKDDLSDLVDL